MSKLLKTVAVLGALSLAACAQEVPGGESEQNQPDGESDQHLGKTAEAITGVWSTKGVGGRTIGAVTGDYGPNTRFGSAAFWGDGRYYTLESCLQQLVTGGWETIQWSCSSVNTSGYAGINTGAVPYWTNGRWYRTAAWVWINGGASGWIVSDGCQGNGGSGCY
jgi:hypothetical protein